MGARHTVDAAATTLPALLDRVEAERETVQLIRGGRVVAEIRPVGSACAWQLPPLQPALQPNIDPADATAPLDPEDWPAEARA